MASVRVLSILLSVVVISNSRSIFYKRILSLARHSPSWTLRLPRRRLPLTPLLPTPMRWRLPPPPPPPCPPPPRHSPLRPPLAHCRCYTWRVPSARLKMYDSSCRSAATRSFAPPKETTASSLRPTTTTSPPSRRCSSSCHHMPPRCRRSSKQPPTRATPSAFDFSSANRKRMMAAPRLAGEVVRRHCASRPPVATPIVSRCYLRRLVRRPTRVTSTRTRPCTWHASRALSPPRARSLVLERRRSSRHTLARRRCTLLAATATSTLPVLSSAVRRSKPSTSMA